MATVTAYKSMHVSKKRLSINEKYVDGGVGIYMVIMLVRGGYLLVRGSERK